MKIFNATVNEGKVLVNGQEVPNCPILGEGGQSSGFLVMAENELVYLPKTSPDLSQTLQLLSTSLSTIATGIYQANLGGDITNPTFASDLAAIQSQVDELRGALR